MKDNVLFKRKINEPHICITDSLLDINLANNRLTSVPESVLFLKNLLSLNLSYNAIEGNTAWELQSVRLRTLDLSHNNLEEFPEMLLQNVMENLVEFSIAFNRLSRLPSESFINAKRLEKVILIMVLMRMMMVLMQLNRGLKAEKDLYTYFL